MNEKLYQLLQKAELDFELRKRIWAAKDAKDPALALCELCTAEGFPLTVGQLFSEQEEFFCNLFRSCNGSAVDPLDGWDDPFEMFFAALEALDKKKKRKDPFKGLFCLLISAESSLLLHRPRKRCQGADL